MKIGIFSTFMSPIATPAMIGEFARRAEAVGVDSLWMGEHVVLFDEMEFPYPGARDGRLPVPAGSGMLDTVATFGYLAAVTTKIRLGTGITLLPQRNPVYTAKEFATLDWLTGGRIDLGIGVGWCKEEVLACGYAWDDRGERCDDFLDLIRKLWTQPVVTHRGPYAQLVAARMDPKPLQRPHVPIIVGGHSDRALRRAVEKGTGWYGFALNPAHTKPLLDRLDRQLAKAGRARRGFEIVVTPTNATPEIVDEFAALGVDRLVVQLGSQRPEAIDKRLAEIERLVQRCA